MMGLFFTPGSTPELLACFFATFCCKNYGMTVKKKRIDEFEAFWQNTNIGKVQIVGISNISAQSSGMIAVGSGEQISANFPAITGATNYLVIPYATGYGTVTNVTVSGTKALISVLNPGSGAHSIVVRAYVIGYKLI